VAAASLRRREIDGRDSIIHAQQSIEDFYELGQVLGRCGHTQPRAAPPRTVPWAGV
jgi:hypothetical protein